MYYKTLLSAKLRKSAAKQRNPTKHLSLSVAISNRKCANRILRPKVVVWVNVKVTAKRLDYYIENSTAFPHRNCVLATKIFPKISVANTRMHLLS